MARIKYVGRPSLDFFGKYLSEIASNLCDRGVGRVVIKESEKRMYKEPCFYVIKEIEPLMSDSSGARCRAYAERVFRGHNFGIVSVPNSHEPDWRLLNIDEGRKLQDSTNLGLNRAPFVPVKCVAPMPPVLALKLLQMGKIPDDIVDASRQALSSSPITTAPEGRGFLLLTKIFEDPTLFQIPVEPAEDEKRRIFPCFQSQIAMPGGLVRKKDDDALNRRNYYYIRRSDTPGLRWRVELADSDVEDELLRLSSPSTHPQSSPLPVISADKAKHSRG
ncbi:unnamed protein product [Hydatigera taeniaeformis]|uniref:28S ribosomal protein S34, mitochondrial n=1 Tax=Hydatigena taeniaeformis TaxID=6205 RepID=A0A0R3WL42_HYDTA|nr:unnamed protein product [Hydatigera taeniaeformis]